MHDEKFDQFPQRIEESWVYHFSTNEKNQRNTLFQKSNSLRHSQNDFFKDVNKYLNSSVKDGHCKHFSKIWKGN